MTKHLAKAEVKNYASERHETSKMIPM